MGNCPRREMFLRGVLCVWCVSWAAARPKDATPGLGNHFFFHDAFSSQRREHKAAPRSEAGESVGAPVLHSLPGAVNIIYLDFGGAVRGAQESVWGAFRAGAFSLDADADHVSEDEAAFMRAVWGRVAEDYAPWRVDVTTERPQGTLSARTSHVLITHAVDATGHGFLPYGETAGGVAFINVFAHPDAQFYGPAFIYADNLNLVASNCAEAVSHEVGHHMGLRHHGVAGGDGDGLLDEPTSWGPIMGTGYFNHQSQWSDGRYPGASNSTQDDVAILTAKLALRADETGDAAGATRALSLTNKFFGATGVIVRRDDVDAYSLTLVDASVLTARVDPYVAPGGVDGTDDGNLDARLTVRNASGALMLRADPPLETTAAATITVPPGVYYLFVDGAGAPPTDGTTGSSDYGSLGQYTLSGSARKTGGKRENNETKDREDEKENGVTPATAGIIAGTICGGTLLMLLALALWCFCRRGPRGRGRYQPLPTDPATIYAI